MMPDFLEVVALFISFFVTILPIIVIIIIVVSVRKKAAANQNSRQNSAQYRQSASAAAQSLCEDGDSHSSHTGVVNARTYSCPYNASTKPRCKDCTDILCKKSDFYQG